MDLCLDKIGTKSVEEVVHSCLLVLELVTVKQWLVGNSISCQPVLERWASELLVEST